MPYKFYCHITHDICVLLYLLCYGYEKEVVLGMAL